MKLLQIIFATVMFACFFFAEKLGQYSWIGWSVGFVALGAAIVCFNKEKKKKST